MAPTSLAAVTVYSPASATRALRTSSVWRSPSALMGRVVLLRSGTPSFLQDTAGRGGDHAWAGEPELSRGSAQGPEEARCSPAWPEDPFAMGSSPGIPRPPNGETVAVICFLTSSCPPVEAGRGN